MPLYFRVSPGEMLHRFLLLSLCSFVAISVHAAPRIECDDPKFDFGTVIGLEKITHEFTIWNRGDATLEISGLKNCCGVEAKVVPTTIPPGSNAVCTSVFTTRNRYGSQDKQILLITNDKKHLYYDLRMTGILLKPIEFTPRFLRLGELLPDSPVSETIAVTNLLERAVELRSVASTVPGLEARVAAGGDRSWRVELRRCTPFAPGPLNGHVRLAMSCGEVEVPVVGTVKPILQAVPDQILCGIAASNTVKRLVMVRSADGRPFTVLSAELHDVQGTVESTAGMPGQWRISLAIHPGTLASPAALTVTTSLDAGHPLRIPILGVGSGKGAAR